MSDQDEKYMRRALYLAEKGKHQVAPNPMVGAVIVYKDEIIGEGYHRKYGEAHAEVNAIASVKDPSLLEDSTIYVNLEPCTHYGKTPPCADLIIEKKLKEVVIANRDPSDKVAGKGIEKLRKAGIEVRDGIVEKEAAELNKRFFSLHAKRRPYITMKWALTKDGFMGRSRSDPKRADNWITNPLSKQLVHQWRSEEMGILVGKNTAIIDDPELNCREFFGRNPVRFLIDPTLDVPLESKIFSNVAKTVVLNTINEGTTDHITYLNYSEFESLFDCLFQYCQEQEIHSIMVEGGGISLKQFIEQNLWDEARVFIGQKEFHSGIPGPIFNKVPIRIDKIRGDQLLHYKRNRP